MSVERLWRAEEVAAEWSALERRAAPSFFQSWTWIGTWIAQVDVPLAVVRARSRDSLLGIGILSFRRLRRRMIVPVNVLSLHETGDAGLDRLAIEYNGFLVDRSAPSDLPAQMLRRLAEWSSLRSFGHDWDELSLPGVREPSLVAVRASGLATAVDRSEPAIGMVLNVAWRRDELLRRLSPNTRSQIRRSLNELAKRGSVGIASADTVAQAHDYLARLSELSSARWRHSRLGSPYQDRAFVAFHRALIARALPRGEVELLVLEVGGEPIGYAYNFLWQHTVHHYASGLAPNPDPRIKPGLCCHVLLAERYAQRGFELYDLMAGEARYKRSLGMQHETLYWVHGQRSRATLRAEAAAIAIKRGLARLYGRPPPSNKER